MTTTGWRGCSAHAPLPPRKWSQTSSMRKSGPSAVTPRWTAWPCSSSAPRPERPGPAGRGSPGARLTRADYPVRTAWACLPGPGLLGAEPGAEHLAAQGPADQIDGPRGVHEPAALAAVGGQHRVD